MKTVSPQKPRRVVLTNATIVDTKDGALSFGRAIAIDGETITSISPRSAHGAAAETHVIDLEGRFVIPGFLDMHAHAIDAPDVEAALTLMLANGITGYRQMSGSPGLLESRRLGRLPVRDVPELLAMPGAILTPANAATPEAAVEAVGQQQRMGADFIKVLEISPPAFFAALGEANRLGLPFVGHLPASVDAAQATVAGMRAIEHLGPRDSVLAGCGCGGAAVARQPSAAPTRPAPPAGADPARFFQRMIANPILFTPPSEFDRYRTVLAEYSDAACRDLASLFVKNDTWHVPTLIRLKTMEFADDIEFRNDPRLRYVPTETRGLWEELAAQFAAQASDGVRATMTLLYAAQLRLVGSFRDAGVEMMAGSDLGGQWVLPGFGLHQEFDLLALAGMTPLEVVQMTTLNGARFLGRESTMGSVAEGKVADLVVLEKNPTSSVAHLHHIHAVVRQGIYYGRDALDAMMHTVSERFATPA